MMIMGIDPGKNGGIATIGEVTDTQAYSDELLKGICKYQDIDFCIVEKVGAMPGQGVTSMFNFGKSFGYILGVLEANDIPYQLVPPQKWKKEFSLNADKGASIKAAKRLFPTVNFRRTERCTKDHDGMAEALLMAEYGRRIYER